MRGYVSPRASLHPSALVGAHAVVLGPSRVGERSVIDDYVVIGYPSRRKLLSLQRAGDLLGAMDAVSDGSLLGSNVVARRFSVIYERVVLGDNVELGHSVVIREDTRVGEGTRIGSGTVIDGETVIGRNVSIQTGVYIPRRTVIGDGVFIGPYAVLTNDRYPPSSRLQGPEIGSGAVIGAGAVLVAPVRIGERAVVAAGAVVTRDVPPETVVAGVPARPVARLDEYVEKRRRWEAAGWAKADKPPAAREEAGGGAVV